ncbi:MAG TPA: dolichyl-phosphate beta-glucosyltransferase [Thermoleophilaceae bacterium]|jgi:glycosyltransferase involved in cell wall biosynthesis
MNVEVVIPVHNEEHVLEATVRRLYAHLTHDIPFSARITIADSASTDDTLSIARTLAAELPGVHVIHLEEKGRGRALRAAWSASDADVLAYMDVDLSTDLNALLPLVAPLLSAHSDLAVGSRLIHGARVERCFKREFISRAYNFLLRLCLGTRVSDAQCGFKAGRREAVQALLPAVENEHWFFDSELLHLAEQAGLRIHEVPVDWKEDPDSRVQLTATAIEDLRGIARLMRAGHAIAGDSAPQQLDERINPTPRREQPLWHRPR